MNDLLYQYRHQALFILLGLILTGTGLLFARSSITSSPKVEIISNENESTAPGSTIVVEVTGSVVNPGVFELKSSSRVDDALTKASGLSDQADLDWVEKTINRAAKLVDGQKIYIPSISETSGSHSSVSSANNSGGTTAIVSGSQTSGNYTNNLTNINTATASELDKLWGIGPVTAQNIIDHRPYSSVEELSERGVLKSNVYERNKNLLSIY